jgi:hypothetical protein
MIMEEAGFNITHLIGIAFSFVIYVIFLVYLNKLEKTGCDCALNWKRNYMIAFIVFSMTWNVANIFAPSLRKNGILAIIAVALSLMFIVVTIQYVNKLKDDKCDCSKEFTRTILYYYAWVMVAMLVITTLYTVWIIQYISTFNNQTQNYNYVQSKGGKATKLKK